MDRPCQALGDVGPQVLEVVQTLHYGQDNEGGGSSAFILNSQSASGFCLKALRQLPGHYSVRFCSPSPSLDRPSHPIW